MAALLDTGFVYALINRTELHHEAVKQVAAEIREPMLLPTPVIVEVAYLLLRDIGSLAVADFVGNVAMSDLILVEPQVADYQRAADVLRQYSDARVDLVDALIVAIAERLDVHLILTPDHRHFRMFRPTHRVAFELLP